MDISIFFSPCTFLRADDFYKDEKRYWGRFFDSYEEENQFPEWENAQIAIIGVEESRGFTGTTLCDGADIVRKHLYSLFPSKPNIKIADLGNLKLGKSIEDTYAALSETILNLLEHSVIPFIIGGSQDLTFATYQAYSMRKKVINLLAIDNQFDFGDPDNAMDALSYMGRIITSQPNYLFHYANLGYQTYLVEQEAVSLVHHLHFEAYRIGKLKGLIKETEPSIRNSDCISVDMNCIKQSESPGSEFSFPTGFSAEEICQMMKYAGINDKLTSIGVYNYQSDLDKREQSAILIAQMFWSFVEGYSDRKGDHPFISISQFRKYIVPLDGFENEIVFYKSKLSDKWWLEIPCEESIRSKFGSHYYVPCSYKDYETALENDLPDRWMLAFKKLK